MKKAIQFCVVVTLLSFQIQSFASPENNEGGSERIKELDQQKSFDYSELIKRCLGSVSPPFCVVVDSGEMKPACLSVSPPLCVVASWLNFQIQSFASSENNEGGWERIKELDQQKSFDYSELIKRCKEGVFRPATEVNHLTALPSPEECWLFFYRY